MAPPPSSYKCDHCGARCCKLWREYQTIGTKLLCCRCAAVGTGRSIDEIDEHGTIATKHGRTDQIGWWVPAVPVDGEPGAYWGYTSVPPEGIAWWRALPTMPAESG